MHYVVVVLELLPPLRLEGSYSVVEAKTWLQLVELPPDDDLPLLPLQPLLRTIAILKHSQGLLYCDLRVPQDSALPRPPEDVKDQFPVILLIAVAKPLEELSAQNSIPVWSPSRVQAHLADESGIYIQQLSL